MASDLAMSGVFSGIDTSTLITKLMQVEQAPLTRLQNQKATLQAKDYAVKDLQDRLVSLQTLLGNLRDSQDVRASTVTSSQSSVVTATAGSQATEGLHSLEVNRLASAQRQVHAGAAAATTLVGAGTFNYTYDGVTRNIVTTSETTLQQFRDLINNDPSNPGVAANLLQYDAGDGLAFHLVLSGRQTGDDYGVTINDAQTTLNGSGGTIDFRQASFTVTQQAQNAQVRIDGYPGTDWIESKSNTLNELVPGLTITLQTPGSSNLTVARSTSQLSSNMDNLVSVYNGLVDKLKTYTGYDSEKKTSGLLQGDQGLRSLLGQIRQAMTQAAGFAEGEDYRLSADLGLEFDKDGKMKLDTTKLETALSTDYEQVLAVLGARNTGSSSDAGGYIQFTQAGDETPAGLYDVEVTFTDGAISQARLRLAGDSEWETATFSGNLIHGVDGSSLEDLNLTANWDGVSTVQAAQVRVKRGFAGEAYNRVGDLLDSDTGRLPIIRDRFASSISLMDKKIEAQQTRLDKYQTSLKEKYARLERTLAELESLNGSVQSMMSQLSANNNTTSS